MVVENSRAWRLHSGTTQNSSAVRIINYHAITYAVAGTISFQFRDITDLDPGEAHTQTLVFAPQADGSLKRTEVYLGDDGPQAPGTYTLIKAP